VHVKLADGGCALVGPSGDWFVRAPLVERVDATGAGDAYAAGVVWSLLGSTDPVRAAVCGVAASTCTVTGFGSQEAAPDRAALEKMIERVRVEPSG
jgi:sugar/nucleoside kinase (ribokinase family)